MFTDEKGVHQYRYIPVMCKSKSGFGFKSGFKPFCSWIGIWIWIQTQKT